MLVDYHMHTTLSDGKGKHEEYIKEAVRKGLGEIGFSDHYCFKEEWWSMKFKDIPRMVERVSLLKGKYEIPVKLGMEMDFLPGFEGRIRKLIETYPFDYVIGSVHFIGEWQFEDSKKIADYKKWDIDELYKVYFNLVQKAAESGLFDIIGHVDLIKKLGFRAKGDISDILRETAEVLKKNNVCIEINSSGLERACKEMYPSEKFLRICFDNGVPITLGSDAHKPEDVGNHFDRALELAKKVGYRKIAVFTKRKRRFAEI